MPARAPSRIPQRLAKAHRGEPVERLAVVGLRRKRQQRAPRPLPRGVLEQAARNGAAPCADARAARPQRRRGPAKPRKRAKRSSASRSAGSVWVCSSADHLQPVLDAAQEAIGLVEIVARPRGRSSRPRRASSSVASVSRPRSSGCRPPAMSCWVCAKNSISRMPPRPSLMLWPSTAIVAVARIGVDLPLHGVNVGDRREVEIFAPDEGRKLAQELLAGRDVAGARCAP